jgi:hypothetical protein
MLATCQPLHEIIARNHSSCRGSFFASEVVQQGDEIVGKGSRKTNGPAGSHMFDSQFFGMQGLP